MDVSVVMRMIMPIMAMVMPTSRYGCVLRQTTPYVDALQVGLNGLCVAHLQRVANQGVADGDFFHRWASD